MPEVRLVGPEGEQLGVVNTSEALQRARAQDLDLVEVAPSGGTWGMVVGHVTPEAWEGGLIALVEEGDTIEIDARTLTLRLHVATRRGSSWT